MIRSQPRVLAAALTAMVVAALLSADLISTQPVHAQATPVAESICSVLPQSRSTEATSESRDLDESTPETATDFDLLLIDLLIAHHESEVVMAQVALERAQHAEIQDLAQSIIDIQTTEIAQLRAWRHDWYPDALEGSMPSMLAQINAYASGLSGMGGSDSKPPIALLDVAEAAANLCNAPEPFDLAFLDALTPLHDGVVQMTEIGISNATRPELRELARSINESDTLELEGLREWRESWFGPATATP